MTNISRSTYSFYDENGKRLEDVVVWNPTLLGDPRQTAVNQFGKPFDYCDKTDFNEDGEVIN